MLRFYPRARLAGALLTGAAACALHSGALAAEPPAPGDESASEVIVNGVRSQTPATSQTLSAADISATVNAVNVEDTIKYMPSLLVRKRHIGDVAAPLATRTSGLGSSARTLIYADGILLSALIGNNNGAASPRWGLVSPDDVDQVSFLYGPFAAGYAGNSIGGVLNIRTRRPDGVEGGFKLVASNQRFSQYGTADSYPATQVSASIGNRFGDLWLRASGNLVDSNGQPLSYITVARPAAATPGADTVTGAHADVNRTGAAIGVFGAGGLEDQVQTNLNLKLGYDLPGVGLVYSAGRFGNDTDAGAETYLQNIATGLPVYSGAVRFGGYSYTLGTTAFAPYRLKETHWAQGLSAASRGEGPWTWKVSASQYDYAEDEQRAPTTALPAAATGGAGTITRMDGTGWRTADASLAGAVGGHALSAGVHGDVEDLASSRYATADWTAGAAGALTQQALGRTRTQAVWLQDAVSLNDELLLTLGARYEDWRASRGYNFSASPALAVNQPGLTAHKVSPKATLAWAPSASPWSVTASYGEAYRFPTVTELYQAVSTTVGGVTTLTVPNPTLRPEHARSAELAVAYGFTRGQVRASLFTEQIGDALISQTAPLVPGSASLFSYVQNIDRTQVNGLELVAEGRDLVFKGLDLSASATWANPKVTRDAAFAAAVDKQLPGVPRFKATMVATWRPDERWTLTAAGRYATRLYAAIDNSDIVTHTYQGFDPFFVADVRVSYQLDRHWIGAIGIDNVGDRRYFLFHPWIGRTVQAELNYRF